MASQSPADNIDRSGYALSWDALNRLLRSGQSWSGHELNTAFLNTGQGRFHDVSHISGFDYFDDARGIAAIDWDHDGDQDFVLRNRTGPQVRFLANNTDGDGRFLSVRLIGVECNRDAIGARVTVKTPTRTLVQTVSAGDSFIAQSSRELHFGLGDETSIRSITVAWPGGEAEEFTVDEINRRITIRQGDPVPATTTPSPTNELASSRLEVNTAPPTSEVPLAIRIDMPNLTGEGLAGETLSLEQFRGRPVIVNFWASWCMSCAAELREWSSLAHIFEDAGVELLALSVDTPQDHEAARTFARSLDMPFTVGLADDRWMPLFLAVNQNAIDMIGQVSLPTSLLIDREGRLAKIYVGPVDAQHLADDVRALEMDPDRILVSAAPYPGYFDAMGVHHAIAIRHLKIAEGLLTQDEPALASAFSSPLLKHLDAYPAPFSTVRRVATLHRQIGGALESVGSDGSVFNTKANALYARASQTYIEAVKRDPLDGNAWLYFSECYRGLTVDEDADALVHELMNELPPPDDARFRNEIGRQLFNLGRLTEAVPYLEASVAMDETDANARYRLGVAQLRLGEIESGVAHVERALSELPPYAAAEFAVARDLEQVGRIDAALTHYRRTLELDPSYEPAREAIERLRAAGG